MWPFVPSPAFMPVAWLRSANLLLLLILLSMSDWVSVTSASTIGVSYGRQGDNLPSPQQVVQLLQSLQVQNVKIYDTDGGVLGAFANTGIDVSITMLNQDIPNIASSEGAAQNWVSTNLQPYIPATKISLIAVGNEILTSDDGIALQLVPAMQNLHSALVSAGLDGSIKISTPHAFNVLQTSYPPSAGAFLSSYATSVMQPLLGFLAETQSVFLVNVYPFFSYTYNSGTIDINYALFNPNAPTVTDQGRTYNNLFDAQIDALISAMTALGYGDIPMVITESGWPSVGDPDQVGASLANAQTYSNNLVKHVLANPPLGTPLRPGVAIQTYIFAVFNEDQSPVPPVSATGVFIIPT